MELKEFMIGDWVTIIQDEGVDLDKQWSVNDYIDTEAEYCEPIPLTLEILEKNGFKNIETYEWHDERYRYRDNDNNVWFDINYEPEYDGFTANGIAVNEVHRLQQVLRLCGLTELADNFKV